MREIHKEVLDHLSRIIIAVPVAIKNNLLFPRKPLTIEEQLSSKIREQEILIQSKDRMISSKVGVIQEKSRRICNLETLLQKKDKEIQKQEETNKSLEFQLQEEASRHKR